MGSNFYFVHFNRQPGVADAVLDENTAQFLRNLYRKNQPSVAPAPSMMMIDLAKEETPQGEPVMSDSDLAVFVSAFEKTGFMASINWYRNLDRNWHLLADVDPIIQQPALMIYGDRDPVAKFENLTDFVPTVDVANLDWALDPARKTAGNEPSDARMAQAAGRQLARCTFRNHPTLRWIRRVKKCC